MRSSEWFWIEDGKIRNIWTAMYYRGRNGRCRTGRRMKANFPLAGAPAH